MRYFGCLPGRGGNDGELLGKLFFDRSQESFNELSNELPQFEDAGCVHKNGYLGVRSRVLVLERSSVGGPAGPLEDRKRSRGRW